MTKSVCAFLVILAFGASVPFAALSQANPTSGAARDGLDSMKAARLHSSSDSSAAHASRTRAGSIELPLAPDTLGLTRPRFPVVRFCVGTGVMWSDFSGLSGITGNASGVSVPVTFAIRIPLSEDPVVEFFGGGGFAAGGVAGGSATMFSASILLRPAGYVTLGPIFGAGGGNTTYAYDGTVMVKASRSYPLICAGLSLVPHMLDLMLMVPLGKEMSVVFESKTYTIRPSGPTASLFLSF